MALESLDCNNCGAPIEVPEGVQFMRCGHCGSRLKVHRDASAHYTEVLERIEKTTRQLEDEVRTLRLQNEIRDLDEAWRVRRESLLVRNKDGSLSRPSAAGGIVSMIVTIFIGIFWSVGTVSAGAPAIFPLFGVLLVIVGIGMAIHGISSANAYTEAERLYKSERRKLEERLRRPHTG
jgi:hypothetical protein